MFRPTDADYWRDGIAMAAVDSLPPQQVLETVKLAHTGEQFNVAVWAAIRLQEIVKGG